MEAFTSFLKTIGFSPAFDTLAIAFLVITSFFYGISIGRRRLTTVLTATYIAFAVFTIFPFKTLFLSEKSEASAEFFISLCIFFAFLLMVFFSLNGSHTSSFWSSRRGGIGSWWHIFILSLLQVGLLVSIVLALFPEKLNIELTPFTTRLFGSGVSRFFWFCIPLGWLAFLKRTGRD